LAERKSKGKTGAASLSLTGDLLVFFFGLPPTEAPFSILAFKLIAIIPSFAKAIKIAFPKLFPANDRRDDVFEAHVAQG
jgi:hypothetical protein